MNTSLRISLIFAVGICMSEGPGICPGKAALAQARGSFFPDDETPQRMHVGMVEGGALIGFERSRKIRTYDREEYNGLTWYRGDVRSGRIMLGTSQTSSIVGQTTTILRRWYWEEGRLWLAFEALYGSFGPCSGELWRTSPDTEADVDGADLAEPRDVEPESGQKGLLEALTTRSRPFGAGETVECLSHLEPMTKWVDQVDVDCMRNDGRVMFHHRNDGFDFIPHGLDHWTFFMTVGHTMQIWDCRSRCLATEEGEEIRNTWTLVTQFWVPWKGQFFVFERNRYEYLLVRDCGEVHELRLDYLDYESRSGNSEPDEGKRWHGRQLLDPVDYLIALIYIERENTVYGFGPNFYVRLAKPEPPGPLSSLSLTKIPCRDVTKGKAIWTDEKGESHELGEPFRTIWQCANVLKEDGVLEAATETETKPQDGEAMPAATRRTEGQAGNRGRSSLPE